MEVWGWGETARLGQRVLVRCNIFKAVLSRGVQCLAGVKVEIGVESSIVLLLFACLLLDGISVPHGGLWRRGGGGGTGREWEGY